MASQAEGKALDEEGYIRLEDLCKGKSGRSEDYISFNPFDKMPPPTVTVDGDEGENNEDLVVEEEVVVADDDDEEDTCNIKTLDKQWFNWVEIRGVPNGLSKYTLARMLEDPSVGFGVHVKDVIIEEQKRLTRVEFEAPKDAEEVLRKQDLSGNIALFDSHLTFSRCVPPKTKARGLLVTGLPAAFLSPGRLYHILMETSASDVHPGRHQNAIVEFKIIRDRETIIKKLENIGPEVRTHPLEASSYLMVHNFTELAEARQTFRQYFMKADNPGTAVQSVLCHPGNGFHVIQCTDSKDAESFAKQRRHNVSGQDVTVTLYYPCLDLDPCDMIDYPDPISCENVGMAIINFIKQNPDLKKKIESELRNSYCSIEWVKQLSGVVKLKCDVKPTNPDVRQKIAKWKSESVSTFMSCISDITVIRGLHYDAKVEPEIIKKLANLQEQNDRMISLESRENAIIVVGKTQATKSLAQELRKLIDDTEKASIASNSNVTKRKWTSLVQMTLCKYQKCLEAASRHGVELTWTEKGNSEGVFVLIGKKADVDNLLQQLYKEINSFLEEEIKDLKPIEADLLRLLPINDAINKSLHDEKIHAMLRESATGAIVVHGVSSQSITNAKQHVRKSIRVIGPLHTDIRLNEAGFQFLREMATMYEDKVVICTDDVRRIEIACLSNLYEELEATVQSFFDDERLVKIMYDVRKCRFDIVKRYKSNEIQSITEYFAGNGVIIEIVDTEVLHGFELKGKKDNVRKAIRKLNKLTCSIVFSTYTFTNPEVREFLSSPEGSEILRVIEEKHHSISQINKEDAKATISHEDKVTTIEKAKFTAGSVKILVQEGNIVFQKCDAIVHVTDHKLNYSTTLGKALIHAGGFDIQKECNNKVKKSGKLSPGDMYSCPAGKLPCSKILNVVAAYDADSRHRSIQQLTSGLEKCIDIAKKQKLSSLAMSVHGIATPGQGNGSIEVMLTALGSVLKDQQSLDTVYIVDLDGDVIDEIIKALDENTKFLKHHTVFYEDDPRNFRSRQSMVRETSDSDEDTDEDEEQTRKVHIQLIQGQLAEQQNVEIIVNSSNEKLQLNHGGVSRSLLNAAGDSIQKECRRKYSNGMSPGFIAVTSGGKLTCSHILHTVIAPWDHGKGYAEKILRNVILKCLRYADVQKKRTIAFPALGTGYCCFPPSEVARIMFDAIHEYEITTSGGYLQTVTVVLFDKKFMPIFQDQLADECNASPIQRSISTGPRRSTLKSYSVSEAAEAEGMEPYTMSFGQTLAVEIIQGDLTDQQTDVIVNSVGRDHVLEHGMVSKRISEAAGLHMQHEFRHPKRKVEIETNGFVVTTGGLLYCGRLIHARARSSNTDIKQLVLRCLQEAEKLQLSSIAFPALGTGAKGCKPEMVAKAMYAAFRQFVQSRVNLQSSSEQHVRLVKVVIYETDIARKFVAVSKEKDTPRLFGGQKSTGPPPLSLHLYSGSTNSMTSFIKSIDTHINDQ